MIYELRRRLDITLEIYDSTGPWLKTKFTELYERKMGHRIHYNFEVEKFMTLNATVAMNISQSTYAHLGWQMSPWLYLTLYSS